MRERERANEYKTERERARERERESLQDHCAPQAHLGCDNCDFHACLDKPFQNSFAAQEGRVVHHHLAARGLVQEVVAADAWWRTRRGKMQKERGCAEHQSACGEKTCLHEERKRKRVAEQQPLTHRARWAARL